MSEAGFTIDGTFYPFRHNFRSLDPVLIRDVTGIDWDEWAAGLADTGQDQILGLMAVSIWQTHPTWPRRKVVQFMTTLDMDRVEFVGGDEPAEEGTVVPLSPPPTSHADTETSPGHSTNDSASTSANPMIQPPSGLLASDTGAT